MASLAESMFATASKSIGTGASVKEGIAIGQNAAILAIKKQELELRQQKAAQTQNALLGKGLNNVLDSLSTLDKFKDQSQANKLRKHFMPTLIQANGVAEVLPPHIQEAMTTDAQVRAGYAAVLAEARTGKITGEEAIQKVQDLDQLLDLGAVAEASKFDISEKGKDRRAQFRAEEAQARLRTGIQAKQEAKQLEFSQFPVKQRITKVTALKTAFEDKGGFAKSKANIARAEKVLGQLKSIDGKPPELITGTVALKGLSNIPFTDQMNMIRTFDSQVALAMDEMQGVINVKGALDSQFSDAMAIRVFSRIIDPLAPNEFNIQRIEEFIKTQKSEDAVKLKMFNSVKVGGELTTPQRQKTTDPAQGEEFIDKADQDFFTSAYNSLLQTQSPADAFATLRASQRYAKKSDDQLRAMIKAIQIKEQ